jgi:hypothetical protein
MPNLIPSTGITVGQQYQISYKFVELFQRLNTKTGGHTTECYFLAQNS